MRSFLREMEEKFIEIEKLPNEEEVELDEINTTGAVASYNTPGAFLTPAQYEKKKKKIKYESVNTPPTFKWKDTQDQTPESGEETSQDKFPFSKDISKWPNKDQEYPVKFTNQPYGTANIKDETKKVKITAEDILEKKYEELLESYRRFATEDKTLSPEQKVKTTIKDIAKKLQEIETIVNYNTRLKTESGISASTYGSSTQKALTKISERLIKISERVRALGE